MTNTAKPTPGPWAMNVGGQIYSEHPAYNTTTIAKVDISCSPARAIRSYEDSKLICEAGTVYHETSLTPRQLLERVRELEAGQKVLFWTLKTYVSAMQIIHEPERSAAINAADTAAKEILAKFKEVALAKHGENQ